MKQHQLLARRLAAAPLSAAEQALSFSGRTIGCLSGCPGVAGTCCCAGLSVVRPHARMRDRASPKRRGVPAWLYQQAKLRQVDIARPLPCRRRNPRRSRRSRRTGRNTDRSPRGSFTGPIIVAIIRINFGTLVVDRRGVEVRYLLIAVGAHRMRQRTGIFGELRGTQAHGRPRSA